jgi:hypothetical protein
MLVSRSNLGACYIGRLPRFLTMTDNTGAAPYTLPRSPRLPLLPFTFRSAFAYNGYMFMIILKVIYVFFLAVFFYLNLWFTGLVSFLKVNFFGI